jgi:uncharacterized surface protein with fasciclin (FAS1) repeats
MFKNNMNNNNMIIALVLVLIVGLGGYAVFSSSQSKLPMAQDISPSQNLPITKNPMNESKTIVDVAVNNGSFNTLVAAVKAAGLVETLSSPGPFTVFAPTDEAFAKLPAGTVESLLKDKDKLTAILTYHVVAGKVMAADVVKLTSAKTVNGQTVTVKVDGSNVMINNAKVVTTDVEASNGIIHVIDTVLLPM